MWVAIIIAVLALLMVAFMPKPNIENARAAKLGDFSIPRAKWGDPIPLCWGRVRQKSPVTLWFGDLKPVPITKKIKDGLFSSKRVTVGHKYYLGLDLLLAAGPNIRLKRIWSGTKIIWTGTLATEGVINIDLPELFGGEEERGGLQGTMRFYTGAFDNVQNAYLQQVLDPDVPAYNGKARAVFEAFYFGTTTSVGALSFELEYQPNALMPSTALMPNGADVNPMEICYDALMSQWAKFGNDVQDIDLPSWRECAQTLYDEGMGASMLLQSAITGKDFLEEIMRHADGILYQDPASSKIVAKLIRQDYDEDDLMTLDESVVESVTNLSKTTWENTFNQCRVQFKDRANSYDESVAIAQDFANINFQNRVKSTDINMPICFEADIANELAARQLAFLNIPLYKCDLVCNRKASKLRPGDVFKFTWGPYGLMTMIMRVSKISLGTLTDGRIKITCVQDRYATAVPTFAPPDQSEFTPVEMDPKPVLIRKLLELPKWFHTSVDTELAANQALVAVFATPPGNASTSFSADIAPVGAAWDTATRALDNAPYHGHGTLAAPYPANAGATTGIDAGGFTLTSVTVPSSLVDSAGVFDPTGDMLLLIDDEIMSAADVSVAGNNYTFTGIRRALLDTTFQDHAEGARCYIIRGNDGSLNALLNDQSTFKVRYLDRTPNGVLPAGAATSDNIALARRAFLPAPPDYLTINGSRTPADALNNAAINLAWRPRNRNSASIVPYNADPSTPEEGERYRIRRRINGGAWSAPVYETAPAHVSAAPGAAVTGVVEFEVYSERDSLLSRVAEYLSVNVAAPVFTPGTQNVLWQASADLPDSTSTITNSSRDANMVGVGGAPAGQSGSGGCNVYSQDFVFSGGMVKAVLAFTPTLVGSWFDDDFSDAGYVNGLFFAQTGANVLVRTGTWGYRNPDGSNGNQAGFVVWSRRTPELAPRLKVWRNGAVLATVTFTEVNAAVLSDEYDGATQHQYEYELIDANTIRVRIYIGGLLRWEASTTHATYVAGMVYGIGCAWTHFHNYGGASATAKTAATTLTLS